LIWLNNVFLNGTEKRINIRVSRQHFAGENYRGADKFLARPGRKQATATEDFEFHISYLLS